MCLIASLRCPVLAHCSPAAWGLEGVGQLLGGDPCKFAAHSPRFCCPRHYELAVSVAEGINAITAASSALRTRNGMRVVP